MKTNSYPTALQAPPPTGATTRPLPANTAQYGLTYQLLLRNAFVALYKIGVGKNERFEVFTIRRAPAQTFKSGSTLPARELLPKDSDFGRTAFCCRSLERALFRFFELSAGSKRQIGNAPQNADLL